MRIAIVNDLALAREAIRRVILNSKAHEIAWTASDGHQALDLCLQDRPDLILMDLFMPRMDGVAAVRRIMSQCPCAILVVTGSVTGHCAQVFEAMGAGALDAVNTPVLEWPGSCKGASNLLAKIETIRKLLGVPPSKIIQETPGSPDSDPALGRLIAIGASAGGPAALARILSYLPATLGSAIVIIQHVDAQFAAALANWLDDQSPLRVRLAQDGDVPAPGTILLAGRDQHLVLAPNGRLAYTEQPEDHPYRPSVDVFFNSVRQNWTGRITGLLLTGMGRDGARGLLNLRQSGHHTIAQDQASSAVYGMPRAAAHLKAAAEILNLDQIGLRLRSLGALVPHDHA
ncbi:MAG TPA: chemotaxis response regulator protein-glutamate methylesterase [Verrucomicrobiae bacterium]|nr:chemotaxis response regulator protein-glutamate methylesterase [Verrucomicrobiae bacterium]